MAAPLNALELLQNYQNNNSLLAARAQQMDDTAQTAPLQRAALQQNMLAKSVDMQRQQQQLNALKDYATTGNVNALAAGNPQAAMQINSMNQRRDYQNAMLGLRDKALSNARVPPGYKANPDGSLAPIPGGPAAPNGQTASAFNLSGDDLLGSLPKPTADQIKALAEGRMQFPSGMALKTPYWQQMLSNVAQYDPQFDAINYNARAKTRADAVSGVLAKTNNALNTGIGHLTQLSDAVGGLNNTSSQTVNAVKNAISKEFGGTGVTDYKSVVDRVAPEITKIWRGTGGSEKDIERDIETLSSSNTPEQLHSAINNIAELMKSKLDANASQYQQGMGTAAKNTQFITPQAAKQLETLAARKGGNSAAPQGFKVLGVEK